MLLVSVFFFFDSIFVLFFLDTDGDCILFDVCCVEIGGFNIFVKKVIL